MHSFAPASGMVADTEDMCTYLLALREDSTVWHLPTLCYQEKKIISIRKGGITSENCSVTYLLSSDTELDAWFGKGFNTSYLSSHVVLMEKGWEKKRIIKYPESKGQHGYFAYNFINYFLTLPVLLLPILSYCHLSAFPRRDLVVHKVRIAALTQTTSPRSPVYLAGVLPR